MHDKPEVPQCDSLVRFVAKLARHRESERITTSEFSYNINLVADDDRCWEECLDLIPSHLLSELHHFAKDFLEPVDFMPGPEVFIAGPQTADAIESKKQELRPRYIAVFRLITERYALPGAFN